jgi:hypothetical protein
MEIELMSESIRRASLLDDIAAIVEESGDAVVPDSLPDIIRIVETAADIEIANKELRGGRVYVDGAIKGSALYVPETGTGLCKISLSIPFSHVFDVSEAILNESAPVIRVNAELISAAARELNPRKITAKAVARLNCRLYTYSDLILYGDIENKQRFGIECKQNKVAASVISGLGEKQIAISDTAELGDIRIEEAEILKYEIIPRTIDTKHIPNKIILKGDLLVRALLSTPSNRRPVTPCETVIPFSGVVECYGITEDSQAEISYFLSDTDLQITEEPGTNRPLVAVKANLNIYAQSITETAVSFIEDVYSTSHELEFKKSELRLTPVKTKSAVRVSSKELIPTGVVIKSVYTCQMAAESASIQINERSAEAACEVKVKAIFEAEDGGVYSVEKKIPVSAEIDSPEGLVVSSAFVSDESYHISGSEDIEVRFTTEFKFSPDEDRKYAQVSYITVGEALAGKGESPSVTLCYCTGNESFWELGKRLKASVSDILGANGLSGDYPPAGKLLLVPRKY